MSKTRNLSDLLDANGDVKSTALDNVPASNDASALTTGTLDSARLPTEIVSSDSTPQLSGDLDTNGNNIQFSDNSSARFGTGSDLTIFHDGVGGGSYINESGTGNLFIKGANIKFENSDSSKTYAFLTDGGGVELKHDNSTKLETTTNGITVTGYVLAQGSTVGFAGDDNVKVQLGNSGDLQIYHDGSNSWVKDNGTGVLALASNGNGIGLYNADGTKPMVFGTVNSHTKLYHDGSEKLSTTSTGVSVTGNLSVSGSISGAGKVGQVVQTVKTDTASTSSSTFSAISGLNATITPSSTSSKILASVQLHVGQSNSTTAVFKLYRGNQAVGFGGANGNHQTVGFRVSPDNIHWTFPVSYEYLDSPSTTSAITYYVYWRNNGNTVFINRNNSFNNDSSNDQSIPISTITLMEILP